MGKAPIGVAKLAKKHGCKVIGVAGAHVVMLSFRQHPKYSALCSMSIEMV